MSSPSSSSPITEQLVHKTLSTVLYPGFNRDIVSFGIVKRVEINGSDVRVFLSLATKDPKVPQTIHEESIAALKSLEGIGEVKLDFDIQDPPSAQGGGAEAAGKSAIPGVKKVVAISSGKGGVGKSTVASNLAVALSKAGAKVGLCDCDLYGPSIALMFGTNARPGATADNEIIPLEAHGIKLMSMGFLLEDESPVIVRGPMATRYTQQFLRQVVWGDLDVLVLDLPPGTGDIQLTIVQTVALAGSIVVTTPQEVALIDARRAVSMFQKVNVPILGIIENMSYFLCPSDNKRYDIFGTGGGEAEAKRLGVPLLGQIPIDISTREAGDRGVPIAMLPPEESDVSRAFHQVAERLHLDLFNN